MRKRGWHGEEVLGSVAWLCRACHSFLHGLVGNEELARGFYTVGLILEGGVDGEFLGFSYGFGGRDVCADEIQGIRRRGRWWRVGLSGLGG